MRHSTLNVILTSQLPLFLNLFNCSFAWFQEFLLITLPLAWSCLQNVQVEHRHARTERVSFRWSCTMTDAGALSRSASATLTTTERRAHCGWSTISPIPKSSRRPSPSLHFHGGHHLPKTPSMNTIRLVAQFNSQTQTSSSLTSSLLSRAYIHISSFSIINKTHFFIHPRLNRMHQVAGRQRKHDTWESIHFNQD